VSEAGAFLYQGENAVQTGMAPGTIQRARAAVVRGRIYDRSGSGLSGVTVTVVGHSEFGTTISDNTGTFSMAVNGAAELRFRYQRTGYLSVERSTMVQQQDFSWLPDAVLTTLDTNVGCRTPC
jgi:hypothetical protein